MSWAVLAILIVSNLSATRHAVAYHRVYSYIENGPESVDAKEMFAAVERLTHPDDVVLFFRARAMMLYTDRRSVENSDLVRMRRVAKWYVMAKGSTYSQTLINPGEEAKFAVENVWENATWVLYRFLEIPSIPVNGPAANGDQLGGTVPTVVDPVVDPVLVSPATTASEISSEFPTATAQ